MKEFKTNSKVADLGNVEENERYSITFTFESIPLSGNIQKVIPGCGCTSVTHKEERVYAKYDTGKIPVHIRKSLDKQPFKKSIKVILTDGTEEELYIKGNRIKR